MENGDPHAHTLKEFGRNNGREQLRPLEVDDGSIEKRPESWHVGLSNRVDEKDVRYPLPFREFAQKLLAGTIAEADEHYIAVTEAIGGLDDRL